MRLRSATIVEKTVETYAPLIPAYQMNTPSATTLVVTKARLSGVLRSRLGRASAATPATTGSTPIPIASAPVAQTALSKIRSLYCFVVIAQLWDRCPKSAENPTATPTSSTAPPIQSHVPKPDHQRRPASDPHASQSSASTSTTKRIASCVRVSAAAAHATNATAARPHVGLTSRRAMSQSEKVASG